LKASRAGDLATVIEVLNSHRSGTGFKSDDAGTAVLETARFGHTDCFAMLRSEMSHVDLSAATPDTELTALHLASRTGNRAIAKLLIDVGAPLHPSDSRGYDALKYAAEAGFADIVRSIIEANRSDRMPDASKIPMESLINRQSERLDTALHLAAANGHLETVNILLEESLGADLDMRNQRGFTPLHCAAEGGFRTTVNRLRLAMENRSQGRGGESDGGDGMAPTLLELAVASQDLGTVRELCVSGYHGGSKGLASALGRACREGVVNIVLYLLGWHKETHPSDGPLQGEDGNTALHFSARHGDVALFASVNASGNVPIGLANNKGRKPVHEAALSGSLSILQRFSQDFDLDELTTGGTSRTPLHLAAEAGHKQIVKWLLSWKCYKRERFAEGPDTAVMLAAENGHRSVAHQLLRAKYADATGPLLHIAVGRGWKDVAKLAVSAGAHVLDWQNPDTKDTALHIAIRGNSRELVEMLLEAGADANVGNNNGESPFDVAMDENDVDIVRALLDGAKTTLAVDEPDESGMTPLLRACLDPATYLNFIRELLDKRKDIRLEAEYPEDEDPRGFTPLFMATSLLTSQDDDDDDSSDDDGDDSSESTGSSVLAESESDKEEVVTTVKKRNNPPRTQTMTRALRYSNSCSKLEHLPMQEVQRGRPPYSSSPKQDTSGQPKPSSIRVRMQTPKTTLVRRRFTGPPQTATQALSSS